jgi:hypothetical protein
LKNDAEPDSKINTIRAGFTQKTIIGLFEPMNIHLLISIRRRNQFPGNIQHRGYFNKEGIAKSMADYPIRTASSSYIAK